MTIIGTYSQNVSPTETLQIPFFDMQEVYLEMVRRKSFQVLVYFLGDFVWINVDKRNIKLSGNPSLVSI